MTTWRIFARFFDGSRRALALSVAAAIGQSLALVPLALVVKHVFDVTIPDGDDGALLACGALLVALYLVSAALALWTRYTVLGVTKRAITKLRGALLERVYSLPRAWFDRSVLGTVQSTIVQDSERLDVMSNALLAQLLPSAIVASALSVLLVVLNPILFLLLIAVVPLLVLVTRQFGGRVRDRTRRWQRAFDAFSTETGLALRAITLTKASGAERDELAARRRQHAELGEAGRVMAWMQSAYTLVTGSIAAIAGVIVLVVGGSAVTHGSMSLGELLSFYAALALLRGQATTILQTVPQILAGRESMERLRELLDSGASEPYSGTRVHPFDGDLAVEDVEFGFGERSEPLFSGVSLTIRAGETVALVGPNGAGKSTLVSLLLGLYRPWSGRLLADGLPYDEIDIQALRRRIGIVPQEPIVFPASVRDNVAYGRPRATDAEIAEASGWATADDFIASLTDGFDTQVGDDGVLLSGGQRQRIALARALLGRPALLVLDEPTLHLDAAGTRDLMANLGELPWTPAVLLITHDPAVADLAGAVYTLDGGRLREAVRE